MKIGNRIKKLREFKNYTQEWMALQLGLSQPAYSKIEKGDVSISVDKLIAIAEILEVNPSDFFDIDGKHTYTNMVQNHKGGNAFVINQAEKALELYDKLIEEKNEHIKTLQKLVDKYES